MKKILKNSHLKYIVILFVSISVMAQNDNNNRKFVIENMTIEGNSKTKDYVIFENLSFYTGDSLSEKEIQNGIEGLKNKEMFSDVLMKPKPGT